MTRLPRALLFTSALLAASCGADLGAGDESLDEDSFAPDQIVGANSVGRRVSVDGWVYVPTNATTEAITNAVKSQMRVLFGAARAQGIGLSERFPIINTASFRRDTVSVVDPANPSAPARSLLRVRYTYRSRAVVNRALESASTLPTATLFATDYSRYAADIIQKCHAADAHDVSAGSIWYHFDPSLPSCAASISEERSRIDADRRRLTDPDRQVTPSEVSRRYLPLTMAFTPLESNEGAYPEYHRLFEDDRFLAYSFFGLDKEDDPYDYGAKNYFVYLRTLRAAWPSLQMSVPDGTDLLRVEWRGAVIPGVTLDRVTRWVLDRTDYPREVSSADVGAFRLALLRRWRDHYVHFSARANVSVAGRARVVPIEIRTYYGDEETDINAAARRYNAAFREADVFQYTGHSHLGRGPLDPNFYSASSFPNSYQLLMVNSCVSFNYYNQFFRMHPGGTRNLDTITNGIEVYLEGAGVSSARFMIALLDGRARTFRDMLGTMRVDLPWERAHDPNRVADGELDNEYNPQRFPLTITPAN